MIPVKKLIELNIDPEYSFSKVSRANEVIPLDHGAFVVRYELGNHKVCNHLGDGFRLDGCEYYQAHNFRLIDDLLYFEEGEFSRLTIAFDMDGNQVMWAPRQIFDINYPTQEHAKYKCDFPRMKPADGETYFDKSLFDSKYGPQIEFNGLHNKYGVAWAINNGLLLQLPITVEKMHRRVEDIDRFIQTNEINGFIYTYLSQYIAMLRMINIIAMRGMNMDSHRNIRRFDNISSSLDYCYCRKR